jgi:hypothetical protein
MPQLYVGLLAGDMLQKCVHSFEVWHVTNIVLLLLAIAGLIEASNYPSAVN